MAPNAKHNGSLSTEALKFLQSLPPFEERPRPPLDGSRKAWRAFQNMVEDRTRPACEKSRRHHNVTIAELDAGPLQTLLIAPEGMKQEVTPALYLHGGGYTCFSARSSLFSAIPLAAALKRPLISIDYPLAPQSDYRNTVRMAAAAITDLLLRYRGASLIGDSAGGGLALSAVNRLAREGPHPQCLILISPWTDLGNRAESRRTMASVDPILQYEPDLRVCAEAYAHNAFDNPDASPLLAEYGAPYPPTFIVCGSREILLSDSLRLHKKLAAAKIKSMLEVCNGMFHSFPVLAPELPESQQAVRSVKVFLDHYCPASASEMRL